MDSLPDMPAAAWTGELKELLDPKESKQKWADNAWFSHSQIDDSEPTSVLDLSSRLSPPLQCSSSSCTEIFSNDPNSHLDPEPSLDEHDIAFPFDDPILREDCMVYHDRDIDLLWTEQQQQLKQQQGFYPDYNASNMIYSDMYQQNYEKAIRGFSQAGARMQAAMEMEFNASLPELSSICSPFFGNSSEEEDLVESFINIDSAEFCEESTASDPLGYGRCHISRNQNEADTMSASCSEAHPLSSSLNSCSTPSSSLPNTCQMSNINNNCLSEGPMTQQIIHQGQGFVGANEQEDQEMAAANEGLLLVHLLLACAEAVACRDTSLAASILEQLKVSAHVTGDSMQRVTCCFAEGLAARLANMAGTAITSPDFRIASKAERMEGQELLYQCCPYLAFGFFAANEAILEAFEGKKQVHILDLGMAQNLQWPPLIRALASRPEGPPQLRITAIGSSIANLNSWGKELSDFAHCLKVPFEFTAASESLDSSLLTSSSLGLRDGELLAINSVLQLHYMVKESRGTLKNFLQSLHRLSPTIMTVVEQDANHNGPFFLGRFLEALYFYSAIFDSLDASLPRHSQQRLKVEKFYFAEEIRNIVACEGLERVERHERTDQWRRQLSRSGFQVVPLKFMSQARMMLSLYSCDGYTLAEEKGCLLLGWKGKPIMLASAWKPCQNST